jgi:hypothetical protein
MLRSRLTSVQEACETFPAGIPFYNVDGRITLSRKRQIIDNGRSESEFDVSRTWKELVSFYTRCNITRDTDRLIAFSAVAKHFQPKFEDKYVAGVWMKQLPYELQWERASNNLSVGGTHHSSGLSGGREDASCAPSWSWASFANECHPFENWYRDESNLTMRVLDLQLKHQGVDTFGGVYSARLTLLCWLKVFRITWQEESPVTGVFRIGPGREVSITFDEHRVFTTKECYFMPITYPVLGSKIRGLVLAPTDNPKEYQRVGVFKLPTAQPRDLELSKSDYWTDYSTQKQLDKVKTSRVFGPPARPSEETSKWPHTSDILSRWWNGKDKILNDSPWVESIFDLV